MGTISEADVEFIKRPQGQDVQADRTLTEMVQNIIDQVRERGDAALRDYSAKFDKTTPDKFEVSEHEIASALAALDPQTRKDSEFAIAQVKRFAEAQLATMQPLDIETLPGVHLGHRIIPIQTVGCYVPGGRYPILSAPVMSIVPAVAQPAVRQSRAEGMQAHRRAAEIRLLPDNIDAITNGERD
ncbi:histidinol dehydrogenase [Buttiauxella massiliensis]|uniref:histidinol dehydrogenase n=1 Tax=Buttiauxella massiliensis TaxID=2831590 RepID=UPI00125EEE35|nr:histidinol dehydrogenase [Buttiauxella massiliensis]